MCLVKQSMATETVEPLSLLLFKTLLIPTSLLVRPGQPRVAALCSRECAHHVHADKLVYQLWILCEYQLLAMPAKIIRDTTTLLGHTK